MKVENLFSVDKKTVLITGGSRGIGEMIASGFCANGAKVYITARSGNVVKETAKNLSEKYNCKCIGIESDISSLEGIKSLSNMVKNEENSSSEFFRSYKFSNIQQLRRIIRNEFVNFNLE